MEKYDNMVNNVYAYNINCMSTQRILCFVIICEVRDRENQGLQRNRCNLFQVTVCNGRGFLYHPD